MANSSASKKREAIEAIMSTCRHFNGVQHDACKAGVNYHHQFGDGPGCFANLPCIMRGNTEPAKQCSQVSCFTEAEAEQRHKEREERTQKTLAAMTAAHEHAKERGLGKGHGGRGELDCPVCCPYTGTGGTLRYSVAGVNGHMHAACATQGCVSWME